LYNQRVRSSRVFSNQDILKRTEGLASRRADGIRVHDVEIGQALGRGANHARGLQHVSLAESQHEPAVEDRGILPMRDVIRNARGLPIPADEMVKQLAPIVVLRDNATEGGQRIGKHADHGIRQSHPVIGDLG
jgi:hypothetical protein